MSSASASRPPPAAPRARSLARPCAPTVRPRRAAPAHPVPRAGRPRARAMRARGSAVADDRQHRRRRNQRRVVPAPRRARLARAAAAQRNHRRQRARRWRRRGDAQPLQELALAERLGERLHLCGADFPAAHRACVRPAPAARQWADVGSNGPKPWKETAHARTHTRTRVMGPPRHAEPLAVP